MKIVTGKDTPVLRQKAQPVKEINQKTRDLIRQMRSAMKKAKGIGLAAPQIGKNLQIFVIDVDYVTERGDVPDAFINPEIISRSKGTFKLEEGCLSLPEIWGEIERSKKVTLVGYNEFGKKVKVKAEGLLAAVFQHETDHLNGVLFVDNSPNAKRVDS